MTTGGRGEDERRADEQSDEWRQLDPDDESDSDAAEVAEGLVDEGEEDDGSRPGEVEARLTALRALLDERGASAVLLTLRRSFAWATAGGLNHVVLATESGAASLLVTRTDAVVLAPINEAARIADEELAGLRIEVVSVPWHEPGAALAAATGRVPSALLSDDDIEDELRAMRSVLGPFDQSRLAWLGRRLAEGVDEVLDEVEPGDRENVVAGRAQERLAASGIRTPVVLAAADDRIERYRHPLPGAHPIRRRLMLVLVGERWGLHAAITRFWAAADPPDALAARIAATEDVLAAMTAATQPGRTLGDVLDAARDAYDRAGHGGEWELHHQGGTIAYQGRERIAVPGDTTRIEPGMAFAWNPSITGAKAEETFILRADGSKLLVTRP